MSEKEPIAATEEMSISQKIGSAISGFVRLEDFRAANANTRAMVAAITTGPHEEAEKALGIEPTRNH